MNAATSLNLGYVVFLLLLIASLHWFLRRRAPLGRRDAMLAMIGMSGVVFHAFLFFSGWLFFVQLGFAAGVIGELWFWSFTARKT